MWMSCFSSSSSIADAGCSSVSEFGFQAQLVYTLQVLDIFSDWPGALSGFMCCHGYFWELCQVMKSLNTHETTCSSPLLSCHLCLLVFNTSEDRCSLLWHSCSSSNPDVFWYQSLTPADLLVQTVGILKSRVWYTNLLFLLLASPSLKVSQCGCVSRSGTNSTPKLIQVFSGFEVRTAGRYYHPNSTSVRASVVAIATGFSLVFPVMRMLTHTITMTQNFALVSVMVSVYLRWCLLVTYPFFKISKTVTVIQEKKTDFMQFSFILTIKWKCT